MTTAIPTRSSYIEHPLLVIERILRDREQLWRDIHREHGLNDLIIQMLASSSLSLFLYGGIMGVSNGDLWQALASAIKLPILFLLTLAICLPTLYLFNLVFGARMSVRQALGVVMVAITVTALLTLAFAPITLFFLLTARDYEFFKLLNVMILSLTGIIGLRFLVNGMHSMNALANESPLPPPPVFNDNGKPTPPPPLPPIAHPQATNMSLLYIWIALYGFVGTQLGWTLRPFFGDPNVPFQIFRQLEGNFYVDIVQTIIRIVVGG